VRGIEIGQVGLGAVFRAARFTSAALEAVVEHRLSHVGAAVGIDADDDAHLLRRIAPRAGKCFAEDA